MKNSLLSGGLNPGPLGLESSALTTRPRQLASVFELFTVEGKSITQTKVVHQILVLLRFLFEITGYNGPVFNHIDFNK